MNAITVYRVALSESHWIVKQDGATGGQEYPSKRDAVAEARRMAQGHPAARVIVHYADQTVESEALFHGEARPVPRTAGRNRTRN
jgi:hypothetical protein